MSLHNNHVEDGEGAAPRIAMAASSMSLRDWFAGRAMSEMIAGDIVGWTPDVMKRLASFCYRLADAMLLARGEK